MKTHSKERIHRDVKRSLGVRNTHCFKSSIITSFNTSRSQSPENLGRDLNVSIGGFRNHGLRQSLPQVLLFGAGNSRLQYHQPQEDTRHFETMQSRVVFLHLGLAQQPSPVCSPDLSDLNILKHLPINLRPFKTLA